MLANKGLVTTLTVCLAFRLAIIIWLQSQPDIYLIIPPGFASRELTLK